MDVNVLLEPKIDLERLAKVLDELGHEGRLHTIRTWGEHEQSRLFEAAKGFRPIDLDFVAPGGPLEESVHHGHNTMPMFAAFRKRFAKLGADGTTEVGGYNDQAWRAFSGPGYFTVTKGEGEHEGELVIDYARIPKHTLPTWPGLRANDGLIGGIAFGGMIDYVRGISTHVSIGHAVKHGKSRNTWFAMVRRDRT